MQIYIYQKIREKSKVEHNAINKEAEEVREETVPDQKKHAELQHKKQENTGQSWKIFFVIIDKNSEDMKPFYVLRIGQFKTITFAKSTKILMRFFFLTEFCVFLWTKQGL